MSSQTKGVHYINLLPARVRPELHPVGDDNRQEWVPDSKRPNEWLNMFFDLAIVSSLSAFNATNQMTTPGEVISFLGYYLVVASMWGAHIQYDARYETNDVWHRLLKCVHIAVFVYIGAASGGWQLYQFLHPVSGAARAFESPAKRVELNRAMTSFLTTASACLVHRVVLMGQHMHVWWLGWRAQRRATQRFLGRVVAMQLMQTALLVSCVVIGTGDSTDRLRTVQVGLLFGNVVIEFISWIFEALGSAPCARAGVVTKKYGSLSIMILGEGFIGIALGLQRNILGVGLVNKSVYALAVMTLVVYCNIYGFVFLHFDRRTSIRGVREYFWKLAQLALHFVLLLFLQALLNVIVLSSFRDGLLETARVISGAVLDRPEPAALAKSADYVDRVRVDPDFTTFVRDTWAMLDGHNSSDEALKSRDATVFVYLSETAVKIAEALDLGLPTTTENDVAHGLNISVPVADGVLTEAAQLWARVVIGILLDAYSGIVWLFPSAGGLLIVAAMCSMLRGPINGVASRILHGFQLTTGVVLCSLAALTTKGPSIPGAVASADFFPNVTWPAAGQELRIADTAETIRGFTDGARLLNRLVDGDRAIPVLVAVYTGLTIVTWASLHWVQRSRGTVNDPNRL